MRRRAPRSLRTFRPFAVALLAALLGVVSCGSDKRDLARRPGVAGSSGTAGSAGTGGAGSGGVAGSGGSSAGTGGTGGQKIVEPRGRSVTTLVHGIVDAERVAWCFADADDEFFGEPEPRSGLRYGEALHFEELDGVDLEDDDVSLYALTGELALVSELDCEDAVQRAREEMAAAGGGTGGGSGSGGAGGAAGETAAGAGGLEAGGAGGAAAGEPGSGGNADSAAGGQTSGGEAGETGAAGDGAAGEAGAGGSGEVPLPAPPRLRVARIAAFPAGSLRDGYSLLMVAAGCIGGPAFADDLEEDVCGPGYDPRQGNVTAELVVLSRRTLSGALSLQALHASRASGDRGVHVVPPPEKVLPTISIADGLQEGTLRPREPRTDLGPVSYGTETDDWSLRVNETSTPLFEEHWPDLLERSGLESLEAGRGYTVILIGPSAGLRARKWWNGSALTLVDNDPGGESSDP
jgi:hypothetical protein